MTTFDCCVHVIESTVDICVTVVHLMNAIVRNRCDVVGVVVAMSIDVVIPGIVGEFDAAAILALIVSATNNVALAVVDYTMVVVMMMMVNLQINGDYINSIERSAKKRKTQFSELIKDEKSFQRKQ